MADAHAPTDPAAVSQKRDDRALTLRAKQRQLCRVPLEGSADGRRPRSPSMSRGRTASRWRATTMLERASGDAAADAPHGAPDRQGRKHHAVERPVRRSRAGHRQRRAVGRCRRPRSMRRRSCKALDRYPFGCSEQITSRALPLLYVNDLAASAQLALDTERRSAHPGRRSSGCWRGRAATARSACGRPAVTIPGSMPMSPTS